VPRTVARKLVGAVKQEYDLKRDEG
jgi:hypothetical protein